MNSQDITPRVVRIVTAGLAFYLAGLFLSIVLLQAGIVLLFAGSIPLLATRWKSSPPGTFEILIILYFISGLFAVFLARNPANAFPQLMRHLALWSLIPLLIVKEHWSFSSPKRLAQIMVVGGGICALAGFYYHFFVGLERTQAFNGRYFTLAALLTVTLPVTLGYILTHSAALTRGGAFFSAAVQLTALWWTYTRSAFLALLVGLSATAVLFVFRKSRSAARWQFLSGLLFLLPVLILIGLIWQSPDPRINPFRKKHPQSSFREPGTVDLSSGRSQIYRDALHILSDDWQQKRWVNLLFGHGLRSRSELVSSQYKSWESDYVQILLNQGIIGLLILSGIYLVFLKHLVEFVPRLIRGDPSAGLIGGYFAAGLAFWIMSFFTLQISNIYGCAYFVVLTLAIFQLAPKTASG